MEGVVVHHIDALCDRPLALGAVRRVGERVAHLLLAAPEAVRRVRSHGLRPGKTTVDVGMADDHRRQPHARVAKRGRVAVAERVRRRSQHVVAREFRVMVERDPAEARARLLRLMADARYVRAEAARRLHVSPTVLRTWITRVGLDVALDTAARAAGYTLSKTRGSARPDEPQFVYFVQAGVGGPIKIGWSAQVKQRLASAQVDNHEELILRAMVPGGPQVEARLHAVFASASLRGEWFRPVKALVELVEALEDGASLLPILEAFEDVLPAPVEACEGGMSR